MKHFIYKIFGGTRNARVLAEYQHLVDKINKHEDNVINLSDSELKAKTIEFRDRFTNGESLDKLLVESFAVCREASKRCLNMRHFDVQLLGGIALHNNKIAEMRTGEGKTLAATLAAYLNALSGKNVHIITVNEYLAQRDADNMGKLFAFLGLTVGVNISSLSIPEKQEAYKKDIVYGTNSEFGFDYLRDNMVFDLKNRVQTGLNFAIIDEVDSILIDEARTPLIISGPTEQTSDLYVAINKICPSLVRQEKEDSEEGDFWVDEKASNIILSDKGHEKLEEIVTNMKLIQAGDSLYSAHNIALMHHILASLKAHHVYHKDQHYVVQDNEVIIVDEFTGRLMQGRRWSDGLHQAVEAKEGVTIQQENQTLASITIQNFFRMYTKLGGMTGTANTEAQEFQEIYNLETLIIPTNRNMIRSDFNDKIYINNQDKYLAIITDIKLCLERNQPVLIGTTSVEASEYLSSLLEKEKIKHVVLNAKNHEKEAQIIAMAGMPGSVTVSTNMAGRGTDIILGGGNPEHSKTVIDAGGLYVIGTERHESRRVDNQLRGRSGRQGDVGSSRFYLSLDDSLLRIFGGERISGIIQKLGMKAGESIEHSMLSKSIENAQKKVENHNFEIRKQLLEYDNVANLQRKMIYQQRNEILENNDLGVLAQEMADGLDESFPQKMRLQLEKLNLGVMESLLFMLKKDFSDYKSHDRINMLKNFLSYNQIENYPELINQISKCSDFDEVLVILGGAINSITKRQFNQILRNVMLQNIDYYWQDHLSNLDYLRQSIGLRGYAQKNPQQEYKQEALTLFSAMLDRILQGIVNHILMLNIEVEPKQDTTPNQTALDNSTSRNALCSCGSGKKYKHCCGKI
jgi:preprotein translocase subunit SecA